MSSCNKNQLIVGDAYTSTVTITTKSGTLIDPATVIFQCEMPDGTIMTYTYGIGNNIVKNSTGNYSIVVVFTQSGVYRFSWQSSGNVHGIVQTIFTVNPSIIQ